MPLYAGMSVNERLLISGQMDAWEQVPPERDRGGDPWPETVMAGQEREAHLRTR